METSTSMALGSEGKSGYSELQPEALMDRIPRVWDFTYLNIYFAKRFLFSRNLHENMNMNCSVDLLCASVLYANTWNRPAN